VPSAANADALALQRAPVAGDWVAHADESTFAARFSDPQTGELFAIVCNAGNGSLRLTLHGLPASATTLRLISATHTLDLPASGATTVVSFTASAPEHDALIATLGTPGDRFAIDAGGVLTVFPWNDALATTLHECR